MSSGNELVLGNRQLLLHRSGKGQKELRAWDAADPQLIEWIETHFPAGESAGAVQRIAIVDDSFGALTLGLADYDPVSVSDSALARDAAAENACHNGITEPVMHSWLDAPDDTFDVIVMKVPRQADYLEYLLRWANDHLTPDGLLIAGGMIKHLPDRCASLFSQLMTSNEPQRAQRKARVILARRGKSGLADWSGCYAGYPLPGQSWLVDALPAVFSRERLDLGSRVFLPEIERAVSTLPARARVLDLGCGNGVLGLSTLVARADLAMDFADVSSQAVASVQDTVYRQFPDVPIRCHHVDGVPSGESYDLILCNPPFHEGGAVGDHIALRMFRQSARALNRGGRLLVVGNRHLGYHVKLRRHFDRVEQVAATPKFVVFACSRR